VPLSVDAQQLPTFQLICLFYMSVSVFWTDHSRIETRIEENQLVRVEANNFMRIVRLSCPHNGTLRLFDFQLVRYIIIQDSTEHFPSTGTTRAIVPELSVCTALSYTILCSISYAYN